jgi:hypothetical protein
MGALALACTAAPASSASAAPQTPIAGEQSLHPTIYTLEQLRTAALPVQIQQKIGPLHTLHDVEDLLKENLIPFGWRTIEISSGLMPPDIARQIAALPPKEVFVINGPEGATISVVIRQR